MTDKTFEEQFPSLKGRENFKIIDKLVDKNGTEIIPMPDFKYFNEGDILEFCLDKQKVRDAIQKMKRLQPMNETLDKEKLASWFVKELGL